MVFEMPSLLFAVPIHAEFYLFQMHINCCQGDEYHRYRSFFLDIIKVCVILLNNFSII
jgi:hypothetical protein